ncbi:TonB-dependent siderophore receptor [Thalassotalea ponticola]|uniref:TonB-dependent receptor n=1 Tax=Thalassotalea ponticola TaxID=1523392 RepID=UPI0025B406BD|nr:TonB-dependent siderophore receptor [Thalassotalea ponticola]MDN3651622.1 TonB-dependent siderophore receptor [Thalassotalea ponticola]
MKFAISAITSALFSTGAVATTTVADVERITVEGQYLSVNQSNSIKTPTPVIDVPQSLTIISAEQIAERGITQISQIVDYTPGLNTSQGEGHRDSVVFRGVRSTADFFIDGNRDDVQYYRSLYNIEQVEILRGPNALLFGRGGTGGILNRVTKKAQLGESETGYQASVTSFGGYNAQLDSNIAISNNAALRINGMYEQLENHRDFFDGERIGLNPTLHFEFNDHTNIDLSYEYVNHHRFIDRGIATDDNGKPIEDLKDVVFADRDNNYHDVEAHVFRASLEHNLSAGLKLNVSGQYGDFDKLYSNFYASDYDQQTNIVTLDGYIDGTQRDSLTLSTNLVGEFDTVGIEHTIIFGGEYIATHSDQYRFNPVFSSTGSDKEDFIASRPIALQNFVGTNAYGEQVSVEFSDLNDDTRVDLDVLSFYLQDELALSEHLNLVLGARFDRFDIEVFNADPNVLETRKRVDEQVSPRAGLIYKPADNVSFYVSYSESFLPRSGEQYTDINGNDDKLEPDTYSNQELGFKWDVHPQLSITAAVFENSQSSPQTADNDPATLDVIDSEISGAELQMSGLLTDQWYVSASYSYLDGEIVDRNGSTGRTPRELPENTASIYTHYEFSDVFGAGIGATYQGESYIDNGNAAKLPSYTRIDASAYYKFSDHMRIQVNVENLTDTSYFPNAHSIHQVTVGAPLNAKLSLIGSF